MEINCSTCNKPLKRKPSQIKKSKNFFCDRICKHKFYSTKVNLKCPVCNKSFSIPERRTNIAEINTCSQDCAYKSAKLKHVTRHCLTCGKAFSFKRSAAKYFPKKYCSRPCANKTQPSGPESKLFTTGIGCYRKIAYRSMKKICAICGKTKKHMDVHHIDHNRLNNEISNLQVLCRSCHIYLHRNKK